MRLLLCNFRLTVFLVNLGNSQIQQGNNLQKAVKTTAKEAAFQRSIIQKGDKIEKVYKVFCYIQPF